MFETGSTLPILQSTNQQKIFTVNQPDQGQAINNVNMTKSIIVDLP